MPKVTNAFTTYQAKGNREDLADAIFNIDPVDTIFLSMSDTRSISNVMFDWQTEKLPAVNPTNSQIEGFQLTRSAATPTVRINNVAQISSRDATVSGTQEAADAAGKSGEMSHQMALVGKALKRDMETILLSGHPYGAGVDDTTGRTTRGLEHWITTHAYYGAAGANPVSPTAPITPGGPRVFTEAMLADTIQATYDGGGEPDHLLMGSYIKRVFSTFEGRQDSRRTVDVDEVVAAVDFYVSDFGEIKAYPSRWINPATVIGWDPDFSKVAYYRKMDRIDIGTIGDATTKLILSEYGLQCSNEAAHFKIADLITSGPITMAARYSTEPRVIGGLHGPAAGAPAPTPRAAQTEEVGTAPGTLTLSPGSNASEVHAKAASGVKGSVVWGDGTADGKASHSGAKHTFEVPGDYVVRLVDEAGILLDQQSFHVPI